MCKVFNLQKRYATISLTLLCVDGISIAVQAYVLQVPLKEKSGGVLKIRVYDVAGTICTCRVWDNSYCSLIALKTRARECMRPMEGWSTSVASLNKPWCLDHAWHDNISRIPFLKARWNIFYSWKKGRRGFFATGLGAREGKDWRAN